MLLVGVAVVGAGQERFSCPDQIPRFLDRGRDPADPEGVLPQALEIGCGVKRRIGHMVDFFGRFQVFFELLDDRQDGLFVGFVAGECLEEERNPILV